MLGDTIQDLSLRVVHATFQEFSFMKVDSCLQGPPTMEAHH